MNFKNVHMFLKVFMIILKKNKKKENKKIEQNHVKKQQKRRRKNIENRPEKLEERFPKPVKASPNGPAHLSNYHSEACALFT